MSGHRFHPLARERSLSRNCNRFTEGGAETRKNVGSTREDALMQYIDVGCHHEGDEADGFDFFIFNL